MIRTFTKEEFIEIYDYYLINDFPDNERKPLEMILKTLEDHTGEALGLFDKDRLCGYATILFAGEDLMLDYYAVFPGSRGKGYGTRFLKEIKNYYKESRILFIEAERNDSKEAQDRLRFYEKAGCHISSTALRLYYVDYQILTLSDLTLSEEDIKKAIEKLYDTIYPHFKNTELMIYL